MGSSSPSPPGLSSEEKALLEQQANLLGITADQLTAFMPELYRMAGYQPGGENPRKAQIEAEIANLESQRSGSWDDDDGWGRLRGRDRRDLDRQISALRDELSSLPVSYERMSDEDRLAGMTGDQRRDAEIERLLGEQVIGTLEGGYADPATERSIEQGRTQLMQSLAERGIQPGSTAYAQAISNFEAEAAGARGTAYKSYLSLAEGLLGNREGLNESLTDSEINRILSITTAPAAASQGYQAAIAPYQQNRAMEYQGALNSYSADQTSSGALSSGLMGAGGASLGLGAMIAEEGASGFASLGAFGPLGIGLMGAGLLSGFL